MSRRRKSREIVFSALYQLEHGQDSPQETLEGLISTRKPSSEVSDYARRLMNGILARSETIDTLIEAALENWDLARLAGTDRNVLRLAVGELLTSPDTPAAVILDEAVELARRYGDEKSDIFVNGVLDKIARGLRPEEMRASPRSD